MIFFLNFEKGMGNFICTPNKHNVAMGDSICAIRGIHTIYPADQAIRQRKFDVGP